MWGFAEEKAAYLWNRNPPTACENTPIENWYCRKPDFSRLLVFRHEVFTKVLSEEAEAEKEFSLDT